MSKLTAYTVEVYKQDGRMFQERYDTPYFCSPSSESYFSM